MSLADINAALRAAGATQRENFILTGMAFLLTKGDASYQTSSPPSKGAWAVSQEWYAVPSSLENQAKQALNIFRQRDLEALYFENKKPTSLVTIVVTWWFPKPTDTQLEAGKARYLAAATSYVSKTQKTWAAGLPDIRFGSPLLLIGAALAALYLLSRRK